MSAPGPSAPRRRFFPARLAQVQPAPSVQLALSLQPLAPSAPTPTPAPSAPAALPLPSWVSPSLFDTMRHMRFFEHVLDAEHWRYTWEGDVYMWWRYADFVGAPQPRVERDLFDDGYFPLLAPTMASRLVRLGVQHQGATYYYVGICMGARASEVRWLCQWDSPPPAQDGLRYEARSYDGTLVVLVMSNASLVPANTLHAQAWLDDVALGELVLEIFASGD